MKLKITIMFAALFLLFGFRETVRLSVDIFCETKEIYFVCFDNLEDKTAITGGVHRMSETVKCRKSVVYERQSFISSSINFYGSLILESIGTNTTIGKISNLFQIRVVDGNRVILNLELKMLILLFGTS